MLEASLDKLYKNTPGSKALADKAVAVLVFPSIVKGGFIVAGQFGDGALRKNGKTVAYYRSLAGSYGFQAGAQAFGYVLFFMDDASVSISTTAPASNLALDRAWSCWTRGSAKIYRPRH
jgi:lipid-binding SYLF domain-containing protein